jgi:nitroreductase
MQELKAIEVSAHEIKKASTNHDIFDIIKNRWSARAFAPRPIEKKSLEALLEAASWSPSSMNEQPWRYMLAINGTEEFDKMVRCLTPGNQIWAQHAAVMILSTAEMHHSNGHANAYAFYDTGAANQTLLIQAAGMGILGHLMGGFDSEKTVNEFNIPDSQKAVVFIALGYPTEPDQLPEPFKTREMAPRSRKPLEEIVTFL